MERKREEGGDKERGNRRWGRDIEKKGKREREKGRERKKEMGERERQTDGHREREQGVQQYSSGLTVHENTELEK